MRHIIRELGKHIPPESCGADVQEMLQYGCATVMHIVPLAAPRIDGEDHTKDIDFTARRIRARWQAGYADTVRALERAPWRQEVGAMDGIVIHEEVLRSVRAEGRTDLRAQTFYPAFWACGLLRKMRLRLFAGMFTAST